MSSADLSHMVQQLASKVAGYRARGINEQNTKNALIAPILSALGWDVHDLDLVSAEWRPQLPSFTGNPVDYALLGADGRPVALVEAKALPEKLDKHASQAASYAQQAAVKWSILTNGYEWRVYRAGGIVPGEPLPQWLQLQFNLGDAKAPELLHWLQLVALREGELEAWLTARSDFERLNRALAGVLASPPAGWAQDLARAAGIGRERVLKAWPQLRMSFVLPEDRPVTAASAVIALDDPVVEAAPSPEAVVEAVGQKNLEPKDEAHEVWVSAETPPTPGTRPVQVRVLGQVYAVRSWAQLLVQVARVAEAADPKAFERACDDPQFAGRKSRKLGLSQAGMRKAVQVGNGWVEVNMDAGHSVELALMILRVVVGVAALFEYGAARQRE